MRNSLFIRLHNDESNQHKVVSWVLFDTAGDIIESAIHVPLDTVPRNHRPPFVLIPSTNILLTQIDIPTKQWKRIVQAVPYAVEVQLAENVENLHFALGKRESLSGDIIVAVIARCQMDHYLQLLGTVGFTPAMLVPDVLAVPKPKGGWGILFLDDVALVRTGLQTGFAIEYESLGTALRMALVEHKEAQPQQIVVFIGVEPSSELTDLYALDIPVTIKTHEQGVLAWLALGVIENQPLNLLQGDYCYQDKMAIRLRPWRLMAALLVLLGGLHVVKQYIEYEQLILQRQALNTQIERVFQETFPETRKIVNPRIQMEQKLKELQISINHITTRDDNFLSILNKISTQLAYTPGFYLNHIDFYQGRFELQFTVANLQALEYLKQRLINHSGLTVKIQSATSRNEQVECSIRLYNSQLMVKE
jgi:general secretion pathway protein L